MPAPANDNFADAEVLSGDSGSITGTNVDATWEVGEPAQIHGDGEVSVWYLWTPSVSGTAVLDLSGSDFDTVLEVYVGGPDLVDLSSWDSDDDSGDGSTSRLETWVEGGVPHWVRVNGFSTTGGSTDYGSIALSWSLTADRRVLVVSPTGYVYGDLANAVPVVSWELNGPGGADISLAPGDSQAPLLIGGREVQVWNNGNLIFWGPLVRGQATMESLTWQCAGLLWYFSRRYFGQADRVNLLSDGDFELDAVGWDLGATGEVVSALDPAPVVSGEHSVYVDGSSYVSQVYTHSISHPLGDLLTLAAWVYIPSADYVGPNDLAQGLYVERRTSGGDFITATWEPINDETPKDTWLRFEIELPYVQDGDQVEVRLYAPDGVAYWDLAVLTAMESLSFFDTDVHVIAGSIVLYAQDRYSTFASGKSDLNIDVELTDLLGLKRSRTYQFAEHRQILDALTEFTETGDFDMDVIIVDETTRRFVTYAEKGEERATTLSMGTNLSSFSWSWDGEAAANSLVVIGPGDGPDREEGAAVDTAFLGGLTLEAISTAPDGATVGELDARAAEELKLYRRPEILEVTTRPGVGLVGVLQVGDWMPVDIDWGGVTIDGDWRIVRMTLDVLADTLSLTLNPIISAEEAMARFPRAVAAVKVPGVAGVWVVGSDGGVGAFGSASFYGSMGGLPLNAPMVDIVPDGSTGYWLVGADGGIFAFGSAPAITPYAPLAVEYAAGDRAVIAAEGNGTDAILLIADDGNTYALP